MSFHVVNCEELLSFDTSDTILVPLSMIFDALCAHVSLVADFRGNLGIQKMEGKFKFNIQKKLTIKLIQTLNSKAESS